ncbi:PAAR domain-containing protein [Comamonadaceae bacterium OTU4NAUVB1]|nr:PAAR domain-containing protein [Comamonadaceae bacterium OTU4NAUVB1]
MINIQIDMTSIFKRADLYGKSQAALGDMTSHGGVITSGSPNNSWHGLPIARKGDDVFCPRCPPHFFKITEGLPNCTDTNAAIPMATEGHLTGCGVTLIAESAPADLLLKVISFVNGNGYDDRYVLRDSHGSAMPNTYYGTKDASGKIAFQTTDQDGHTHVHLTGEHAGEISFFIAG